MHDYHGMRYPRWGHQTAVAGFFSLSSAIGLYRLGIHSYCCDKIEGNSLCYCASLWPSISTQFDTLRLYERNSGPNGCINIVCLKAWFVGWDRSQKSAICWGSFNLRVICEWMSKEEKSLFAIWRIGFVQKCVQSNWLVVGWKIGKFFFASAESRKHKSFFLWPTNDRSRLPRPQQHLIRLQGYLGWSLLYHICVIDPKDSVKRCNIDSTTKNFCGDVIAVNL